MKTSSAKAKGRRAAQQAKQMICEKFSLDSEDIVVTSSGDTGEDLKLSPVARERFPFTIECKNQERLNIWKAYEQAIGHSQHKPIVIFKRNKSEMMCALKFEDFLEVINDKNNK